MNKNIDITQTLISYDYIYSNLSLVFPDSVFLNLNFEIIGVSVELQQSLGYTAEEICGQSISILNGTNSLENAIRQQLSGGFFSDLELDLHKKFGGSIRYSISGFYLGLISDISGIIVLKFSNRQEVSILDQQLQLTKAQLDNFIYRAAHDIRGPLATIQGLTNLIKMRKDDTEIDRFLQLIDAHSCQLDERLSQLLYLAEVDEEDSKPNNEIDFYELETHLRKVIEQNSFVDFLELEFFVLEEKLRGVNEVLLKKLLTKITLHFLSLQRSKPSNQIIINWEISSTLLTIHFRALGFVVDQTTQKEINEQGPSLYTDLLKYSKLAHILAAKKIAWKLKASIHIDSSIEDGHYLTVTLPRKRPSGKR